MISESELPRHRWWHRFFTRKMGTWREDGVDQEKQLYAVITRTVLYCPFCRTDFHEGGVIRHHIDKMIGRPPTLTTLPGDQRPQASPPPENVVTLAPKRANEEDGDYD